MNVVIKIMDSNEFSIVDYALCAYNFIIRGKGEMTGKQWADEIRKVYENNNVQIKMILHVIEEHVLSISVTYHGTSYRLQ